MQLRITRLTSSDAVKKTVSMGDQAFTTCCKMPFPQEAKLTIVLPQKFILEYKVVVFRGLVLFCFLIQVLVTQVCSLCENLLSSTLTISVLVWHEFMLQLNVHIQKVIHSGVPYHVNFGKNTNSSSQLSGHHEKEKPFQSMRCYLTKQQKNWV